MNYYNNENFSRSKWLKAQPRQVVWENRTKKSVSITLALFERHLHQYGAFDYSTFGLPEPRCAWLDFDTSVGPDFHYVDPAGIPLALRVPTTLGDRFPLVPLLDREGVIYPSFQLPILGRIVKLRRQLIESSDTYQSYDWLQDLRALVSECVSLVDITLHQVYFKAQYDPLPGWSFDQDRLGNRHGRRLLDKLGWVHKITNETLNWSSDDKKAFAEIKNLRNHLSHFDPPCFCFTLEDAARWLNQVKTVGRLNWQIRTAVRSPLSVPLIELLLAEDVVFVPRTEARRIPQPDNVGYGSVKWPDAP